MQVPLRPARFYPSAPLAGNENVAYRASNVLLRGREPYTFYQAYAGSENINEPLPAENITGTISFSPSSTTVTGNGTSFLDELHLGQRLLAEGEPLVVLDIIDQETFINARVPTTTEAGVTAARLPNLFALDYDRASQLSGNAIQFDKGTIVSVGSGTLYKNGNVLAGEPLTATRRAQVALYDATTETYTVEDVGFDVVPTITNGAITVIASGGTKNMSAGYYSFMLAYYSDITTGHSNPTDVLLASGTTGYQISAANSTFGIDISAGGEPPAKATGLIIYATAFGGSSATSQVNAIQGPWYELKRVPFTEFIGDFYSFDYVDADLSTQFATQDNDTPPDAEFVTVQAGFLNLVSTNGPGVNSTGREASTSPGPMVAPMSAYNFDAFPATTRVPTENGESILGFVTAAGRLFVMTANSLQAATPTGLPTAPFTLRPFWKRGFVSPDNLIFIDDTLYGFSGNKMFRSIATGDTAIESYDFAADVEAQLAEVSAGYVLIAHDPKNELVCVFASAVRLNENNYWETDVYCYSLTKGQWTPTITLSDPERDMVVSGAAEIGGALYFVAGGRVDGESNTYDTFKFDSPSGDPISYHVCWALQDMGVELVPKTLSRVRPKGKFTNASVSIYGVAANQDIDVNDLATGDDPILTIDLDDSTEVKQYEAFKVRAKSQMMLTGRVQGESVDGHDEIHEIVLNVDVAGSVK